MVLSEWFLRRAAHVPRPLVVTTVYGTRVRLLAEAECARRGWKAAEGPGDAGLLVVCGTPDDRLGEAVRRVWNDLPCPRALVELPGEATAGEVRAALDGAVGRLADLGTQRADAAARMGRERTPGSAGRK
jgi:hypothetical protein